MRAFPHYYILRQLVKSSEDHTSGQQTNGPATVRAVTSCNGVSPIHLRVVGNEKRLRNCSFGGRLTGKQRAAGSLAL